MSDLDKTFDAEDRDEEERMTREQAEELAEKMIKVLVPYVDFIEICGSYRRGREDPGDLDIVVILNEDWTLPEIIGDLETSGLYTAVNWLGEKKTQIIVDGIKVDIKVSTPEGLGAALLYFTGPSGYNIGMRRAAKSRGMKLNEYGIWDRDTNTYLGGATEEEIYDIMDKTFKPPEKRAESEDYGVGPLWMAETFAADHMYNEYVAEIRSARGEKLWSSPCPDYDYLVKEIGHMLKTPYYAIDVFTTDHGRRIHMATIKYGKVESGPLSKELGQSLGLDSYGAESFEELREKCDDCGITFGNLARKPMVWIITVGDWDNTRVLMFCNECWSDNYDVSDYDAIIDFSADEARVEWSDADLFLDWLKDENLIFHELTNRTHKGPKYGAFRSWEYQYGVLQPTRKLWEESNFHLFEQTSWELMNPQSPYPFALKAEEGLKVMADALSSFLMGLCHRAARELDVPDWYDTSIIVDFSDAYAEDQLIMIFPDGSQIELAAISWPSMNRPKIVFVYDEQEDTAELDWVVSLKIVTVDGSYDY